MENNQYKKLIATYLILIFTPAVFGIFLYFCILSIDKNYEIDKIKSKLSERAIDFMSTTAPVDYFKPYFEKLASQLLPNVENQVSINEDSLKNIDDTINNLSNLLNENVRCFLFDKNSNLINTKNCLPEEIRFYTYLWKSSHNIDDVDYKDRKKDQAEVIGRDFNQSSIIGLSEACIQTSSIGRTGVFYFKNGNSFYNGIIVFVEYKRTNHEIVEAKIKDYSTHEQPIILYDTETKQRKTETYNHPEISYERTNSDEFLNGFIENKVVWKGFKLDNYKLLFGQKLANSEKYLKNFLISLLIFLLIIIPSSILFFKNIAHHKGVHISIKYKLIAIFLLAIYMPTLSLWVLSYTSLHDHETAIENTIKKAILDILNNIDNDFNNCLKETKSLFNQFDEYLNSFSGKEPPTTQEIKDKLDEIVGPHRKTTDLFNWMDIRDNKLKLIYTTSNADSLERVEKLGRVLAILGIERYCPDKLRKSGYKPSQSDIIVGNILENPMVGLSSVFERPKEFVFQNFEGYGIYWWWNYYPDENNKIILTFCNTAIRFLAREYFREVLSKRHTIGNTAIKIVGFQYNFQEFHPNAASNYPDLLNLINVSNINKTVESAIVNYENQEYICLCVPGSLLKECFILGMYPTREIAYQIEKVKSAIYTVMIILLIISILTGLLLAKTFIIPVKELDRGLNALRKRETETTIAIENKDELGQLGNAFNQMMADIKDMLIAGAIQQCLIPTGKFEIEGYDCISYNQMATDVGGDYADIFELPENRILLVIGDVTGHGVSSALITAMVKASVFRFVQKNTPLHEIVTNTSNMICDLLNKRKLMTFCAITIDKTTGEMAICNAGHPYPIIHVKKGEVRTPCKTNLPLGVSKKRCRYNAESETLNPGETLVLYTDGFPEAENLEGKEYGYEEFQSLITNSTINNAEELNGQLLEVFKKHHGEDRELADDLTFIIIRRLPL